MQSVPQTKREQKFAAMRREKLRNDLISKFGINAIDQIDSIISTQANPLFAQGTTYFNVLNQVSQQLTQDPLANPSADSLAAGRYSSVPERSPVPSQEPSMPRPEGVPQNSGPGLVSWKTMAEKKDEIDEWGKNMVFMAERDKKRVYREELEEQKRLVTTRRQIQRKQDLEEEKAILAMNSDLVQAKIKERQMLGVKDAMKNQVDDFPAKGKARGKYLQDSNLFNKVEYQIAQKEQLEKEKRKMQEEFGKTLKRAEDDYASKLLKGEKISLPMKDLYYPSSQTTRGEESSLPLSNIRSHYKSIGHMGELKPVRFDPQPERKFAGLPNHVRNYNPISGEFVGESSGPMLQPRDKLPEFLRDKHEGRFYEMVKNGGHAANMFYQ